MASRGEPGSFATLLYRHRASAGLSQEELAERAGLSKRGISDLERGERRTPHLATVRRLAEALSLDAAERATFMASARSAASEAKIVPRLPSLPIPPTSFVGRARELAEVMRLLTSCRLLTLTGAGGSGKTRLALEAAGACSQDDYPDGIALVLLAPLVDPELVGLAIARALGVRARVDVPVRDALISYLRPRRALLLLDNFEHLLDAAVLVSDLLATCPRLAVLATSREALRLREEHEFQVPPLELPGTDRDAPAAALLQCDSVLLFAERVAQLVPDFTITLDSARTVADICLRVDGLPLAIELAAARAKVLSPSLLLERLEHRLPLLVGGARDLPERQRTLRDTIRWSHDLLLLDDRRLFRRLAVFVGGCTLDAAEAVAGPDGQSGRSSLDALSSLVDKHLLLREGEPDAPPRFTMLETIREFALEQLECADELEPVRRTHAVHYLTWLATTDPRRSRPPAGGWLRCLDLEYDNLRAAMRHALDQDNLALVAGAGTALTRYGIFRGHFRELRQWWEEALERGQRVVDTDPTVWPTIAFLLALVLFLQRDHARVLPLLNESLVRFRLLGHRQGMAHALMQLGWAAPLRGPLESAIPLLHEAERLFRELGQHEDVAWTLLGLGQTRQLQGDLAAAEAAYVQALAVVHDMRQPSSIAQALAVDGILGLAFACLGTAALLRGDLDAADARLHEGVLQCARVSDPNILGACMMLLAGVALGRGHPERAANLLGAAEALWGAVASDMMPAHRAVYEHICSDLAQRFGERAFESIRARGGQMTPSAAVTYALASVED